MFFYNSIYIQYDFTQPPSKTAVEKIFVENYVYQKELIDVYGFIQKILGKETIENFTLYKNDYDKIVTVQEENSVEDIESKLQEVMPIFEYCKEEEIPYYYITSLLPVVEEDDLPIGVEDYSAENAEVLMHRLRELEIPLIDLRTMEELNVLDKEALFYKTDHHWTLEACFAAFKGTIRELEANLGWELDGEGRYTDIQTYEEYLKENSFLGSYGIKVGKYYAGKDDYLVYIPKINTHFTFEAYDAKHNLILQKEGTFKEALIEQALIEDESYNNKYNAFSDNGYIENRVNNHCAENDKKVLLISHSYGRPFTQYLGMCFKEVRNIYPQQYRFEDNYLRYIEEYEPDIVLFMGELEGKIIGVYITE